MVMNVIEWCIMTNFGEFRVMELFVQMNEHSDCSNGQTF